MRQNNQHSRFSRQNTQTHMIFNLSLTRNTNLTNIHVRWLLHSFVLLCTYVCLSVLWWKCADNFARIQSPICESAEPYVWKWFVPNSFRHYCIRLDLPKRSDQPFSMRCSVTTHPTKGLPPLRLAQMDMWTKWMTTVDDEVNGKQ